MLEMAAMMFFCAFCVCVCAQSMERERETSRLEHTSFMASVLEWNLLICYALVMLEMKASRTSLALVMAAVYYFFVLDSSFAQTRDL